MPNEYRTFAIEIDSEILLGVSVNDWGPMPENGTLFQGRVEHGREHLESQLVEWVVRPFPAPVLASGESITEVSMSARYVGRDLSLLQDPNFSESIHVVLQGWGNAWRATAKRVVGDQLNAT